MMPSDDENPYAIRVVSDILESNGSSSMATVCEAHWLLWSRCKAEEAVSA